MVENRRVMMTKRLLKESIFELMKKKPLNKITIKELCENADVNRTTFYKYYGDQYSLVKEAEDELLEKTSESVSYTHLCGANLPQDVLHHLIVRFFQESLNLPARTKYKYRDSIYTLFVLKA